MKNLPYIIIAALFILLSCNDKRSSIISSFPRDIEEISSIVEYNPDSALTLFSILEQKYADADEHIKMRLALLKYKAEDKAYVVHSSDSMIKNIAAYYDKHGNVGNRLEACYYMGGTYRDMRNYPLAILWYLKGTDIIDENECSRYDSMILANLHGQLSDMYKIMRDYPNMLAHVVHSDTLKKKLGTRDIASIHSLARCYRYANEIDSAKKYYSEVKELVSNRKQESRLTDLLAEYLGFCLTNDYLEEASSIYSIISRNNKKNLPDNVCSAIARYNEEIENEKDSALLFYRKALSVSHNIKKKYLYAKNLIRLFKENEMADSALHYAELAIQFGDSADSILKYQQAIDMRNDYLVKKYERIENELEHTAAQSRLTTYYAITIGLVILCIFAFGVIYYFKNKRNFQKELFRTSQEKESIKAEHDKVVQDYKCLYSEKVEFETEENLYKLVEELKNSSRTPQHNSAKVQWHIVFMTCKNTYPDFYGRISEFKDSLKEDEQQILCLLKLGLSQSDIGRLLGKSRQRIHIYIKHIELVFGINIESILS